MTRGRTATATSALGVTAVLALAGCGSAAHPSAAPTSATPGAASTAAPAGSLLAWGRAAGSGGKGSKGSKHQGGSTTSALPPASRTPRAVTGVDGTVVAISTSNSTSYALTSAGTVWAWGSGAGGELGNGSTTASSPEAVQVHFPVGVVITALPDPMPYDGGLAIDASGDVWGWGNDTYHQLCLPGTGALDAPTMLPLHGVTLAAGASRHTIFDAGGRIEGCGWGLNGDLGDASTATEATPTPVQGLPAGQVTAVAASWGDEGVVMADGTLYDWGFGKAGQLGDGRTTSSDVAVKVPLSGPVRQVSEGGSTAANGQTVAILTDGSTWVWGDGAHGQMGGGATSDDPSPTRLDLLAGVTFTSVNSGGETSFGLAADGVLWSWGDNGSGDLGTGSTAATATRPVDTGIHLAQVSSTAANVAGLARS